MTKASLTLGHQWKNDVVQNYTKYHGPTVIPSSLEISVAHSNCPPTLIGLFSLLVTKKRHLQYEIMDNIL